jgi:hypothetical protein
MNCSGHAALELHTTYHGDPSRGNKFWVYPKKKQLATARWDFRINPCNNSKKLSGVFASIDEYECLGHNKQ